MHKDQTNLLTHSGVLGMRWGVRKATGSVGIGSSKKATGSKDYKTSRTMKAKGAKNLSTKELKDLTQRLQLEKQFKDLSPTDIKRGIKAVKTITAAGTTLASLYALSKTPLAQDIAKVVKRKAR